MRVVLVLVDGMRPDALRGIETVEKLKAKSVYTLEGQTVMPSVTLPCHMSLMHSVQPQRHGVTTNVYTPQVRPIPGLFDVLAANNISCRFFYNWEELRDISRPGALVEAYYRKGGSMESDNALADLAIERIRQGQGEFIFLYMGYVDSAGHDFGWMSEEYLEGVRNSWKNISRVMEELSDEDTLIVTADHGGHDRIHGTEMEEDMRIPIFVKSPSIAQGKTERNLTIMDVAPTITKVFQVLPNKDWEGVSIL